MRFCVSGIHLNTTSTRGNIIMVRKSSHRGQRSFLIVPNIRPKTSGPITRTTPTSDSKLEKCFSTLSRPVHASADFLCCLEENLLIQNLDMVSHPTTTSNDCGGSNKTLVLLLANLYSNCALRLEAGVVIRVAAT